MPLFVPGPTTTHGNRGEPPQRHLAQPGHQLAGTDEQMAMPLGGPAMSSPSRSSSWVSNMACSSGVRSGTEERRQW